MARPVFWPTNDSYTLGSGGVPYAGQPVRIFTAQTGGTQITDLQYVNGNGTPTGAVTSGLLTSDANGLIPAFAGPDAGPTTVWGTHGLGGERLALTCGPGSAVAGVSSVDGSSGAIDLTGTYATITASAPAVGSDLWLKAWGSSIDALIQATTITRSGTDAATGANVIWPNGIVGAYAGTESVGTPGAIDSYTVTYVGATTKTVTQPALTRSATGAVTNRPAMTVA